MIPMTSRSSDEARPQFVGIDSILYGVDDIDLCHRFYDDWGLRTIRRDNDEVVFETRQGPRVILKNLNTREFMFQSPHQGSSLRKSRLGRAVAT